MSNHGTKGQLHIEEVLKDGKRIGQRLYQANGQRFFRIITKKGSYLPWEEEKK